MKITILDAESGAEDEVIIKCHELNDDLKELIQKFKQGNTKLKGYSEDGIYLLKPQEIYYFESVDQKVFAYGAAAVYEVKKKLYELEEMLQPDTFMRASKSTILNIEVIKTLKPAFGGRFEADLKNGEKTIISRQYVPELKKRLDM